MKLTKLTTTGFTVIEASVALTVTVVLLIIILNFWANNLRQHATNEARATLLSQAHRAVDEMTTDIRLSAAADATNRWPDAHAPAAPTDVHSWQSDASTLILASAAEDSDGNILFADASQYSSHKNNTIYFVRNGNLYRRTLAAPEADNRTTTSCPAEATTISCQADTLIAEGVNSFTVRYLNGDNQEVAPDEARAVELQLGLATARFGQPIDVSYTTRMVFRND